MATVTKRGDSYLTRVRKEGFRPVSRSFIRKADALAWGRRVEADMQAGRWVDEAQNVPALAAAIQQYRERVAVKLKGARDYRYSFKEIEAGPLGVVRLDKITAADLADWRDSLAGRGLKPATVARRLGLLSAVLSWCHKERGWLDDNPMRSVRKPVVRDARTRTLTDDEARYLEIATRSARAPWLPLTPLNAHHFQSPQSEKFSFEHLGRRDGDAGCRSHPVSAMGVGGLRSGGGALSSSRCDQWPA